MRPAAVMRSTDREMRCSAAVQAARYRAARLMRSVTVVMKTNDLCRFFEGDRADRHIDRHPVRRDRNSRRLAQERAGHSEMFDGLRRLETLRESNRKWVRAAEKAARGLNGAAE